MIPQHTMPGSNDGTVRYSQAANQQRASHVISMANIAVSMARVASAITILPQRPSIPGIEG